MRIHQHPTHILTSHVYCCATVYNDQSRRRHRAESMGKADRRMGHLGVDLGDVDPADALLREHLPHAADVAQLVEEVELRVETHLPPGSG